MIINDIEVNGATQKQYAQVAGVTEATITRFINQKANLGFDSILSIVKHKFPDFEVKIMIDYMLSQDNQNARISLEYCMINRLPEIADQLIDKLNNSEYSINREWAKVYEVERMRNKKELSPLEVIARVHKIDAKNDEMKILAKLLEVYATYDQSNYTYLQGLIIGLEQRIEDCKSIFMKRSFKLRLGQALSYIALYNNEVDTCRHYANMIIENTDNPYFKATGYHTLGHSYLYENLEDSLSFFQQALNYYELSKKTDYKNIVLRNMNFAKFLWKKTINTCNIKDESRINIEELEFHEIGELAFYEIRNGNSMKANELLSRIVLPELTDRNKGYYYYYMALTHDDNTDLFFDSIRYFHKSGDKFYVKLPLMELKRLGERESILKIFME